LLQFGVEPFSSAGCEANQPQTEKIKPQMKKPATTAVLVSRAIGFRAHAASREKVFAYTQD
jgi:hypothetical protein